MPLDLKPLLDLTPLDEEEFEQPPEREDYLSPPPMPVMAGKPEVLIEGTTRETIPASLQEPDTGKPVVNVEGSTRATIPASLDVPEPARVIAPFSVDEFTRGDVATPEQRAFTAAQPSEFDSPLVPAGLFKTALDIGSAALPPTELLEGFKEGVAEQLSGMTSQSSAAMTPAFVLPYVGPALALGMGAKAVGAGAGKTVAGFESGNLREVGSGLSEVAGGGTMLAGGGMAARIPRPTIPPKLVETMRRVDAVVPDALPRAKEAAIKKVSEAVDRPIEVEAKVEPVKAAEPVAPAPVEAKVDTLAADLAREKAIEAEKMALLESEDVMTLGENPKWMELSKEFEGIKNRYQGRKPSDVPQEAPATQSPVQRIESMPDAEAVKLDQKAKSYEGMTFMPEDVPALIAAREASGAKLNTLFEAAAQLDAPVEAQRAAQAEYGRNVWFSGAIEIANKKGPNYAAMVAEQTRGKTALGDGPVNRNAGTIHETALEGTGEGASTRPGGVEQPQGSARAISGAAPELAPAGARVEPFFERESEAAGLGRSSLPPTVADVRAQRAADARAATPAAEIAREAEPTLESTPLDPQSGAPAPAKVPDTAGESVKMRKSAERATTAPEIPKPVQERIEAAPESRYTQQSMARVEEAVKTMSDADLAAMPADSNLFVASKLERADRRFRAGDNDGGYAIFVELEKQGTSFGQNINQFKRLAATKPEFVATAIDKKLVAAGKDPLTPAQRAQAIEIARKAKDADRAVDRATDAWTKKPTAENAAQAEAALDRANAEALELQKFVAKFEPKSFWSQLKAILQGTLLTPISEVANIFGNMSFLGPRAGGRTTATAYDIINSYIRDVPRTRTVQPIAGTIEAAKGMVRGLKKIPDILIEGTGSVIQGETRAGLHPIKAWINQFSKNPEMPTTGGKLTLQDRLNLAIEGTLGVPAEVMLRGLGAGDVPFKEAARARVTAEQLKLSNVPHDQWAFAQKFPELFLDKRAMDQIHKDAMAAIFQRESKTLNYLTNLAKSKGELLDFVVATVAPYKLTPWNIVGEILSYNPVIAMAKGVFEARKGNSRAAADHAGKMVVGALLTGTGVWLYKNGLLAPSLDERDESQKARVLSGKVLPPNHINISGLKRATSGGDPAFQTGDETVDVFRAGGLAGAMFYMTANIGRDMERGPETSGSDMWTSIIRNSTLEQARFGLNQSFLSGVDGLLTAIKEGNGDNWLRQWANTVGSIVLPNTLNTLSRSSREYQVDTKAPAFKGKIENMLKSKLGFTGLDDYLPLKRDFWGQPMLETPEGRNAIFYHFFDISKNKQVTSDPVELELYRLWRKTGDTSVIPSLPMRKITAGSITYPLNPEQYERYAELVGENRRNKVDALVVNPEFHKLNDERKMKILERAYRDGMEQGKTLFYREFRGTLTAEPGKAGFAP